VATVGWLLPLPTHETEHIECRRLAELLREKAMIMSDPELKAEYAYLVRGFLDLATQLEQDMAERKVPRKPAA